MTPATSLHLGAADVQAMAILSESMKSMFAIYDVDFTELLETHATEIGVSLEGKENLILTDHPYNSRRVQGRDNSEYDFFRPKDMKCMVQVMKSAMAPGAHGHIFCSALKFNPWYRYLDEDRDLLFGNENDGNDDEDDGDGDDDEYSSPSEKTFFVERQPLVYV